MAVNDRSDARPEQFIELEGVETEADVELKVITPLMVGSNYLEIPPSRIKGKTYLRPGAIDKLAGRKSGYFPDFSVWIGAMPVLIVEAKSPNVDAHAGYREASLYAQHLNRCYRSDLNPCRYVISCNGHTLLVGTWDSEPSFDLPVSQLDIGTRSLEKLRDFCGISALERHAEACLRALRPPPSLIAVNRAGGQATINSKKPFNSFAADLAPMLRRYFTSASQNTDPDIYGKGYVTTGDINAYDRVLDALLKERIATRRGSLTQDLVPSRHDEPKLSGAIGSFREQRPQGGQLQLVTGGVGTGKSLFVRRYKELLQPEDQKAWCKWAFIDFNAAPASLATAENWVCERFTESFQEENPEFDPFSQEGLARVFARDLQRRRGVYDELRKAAEGDVARQRALDLAEWQAEPQRLAFGICEHFRGHRRDVVIAVMDNVDRLDLSNQLATFQLALWFMSKSNAFVILQMRDETYERFKGEPPLDTFRSGIIFHIKPPRFLEVVKRRLELALEYLSERAEETMSYSLSSGARIVYPRGRIGEFLTGIYLELFENRHNISRILQGIAGRNVRSALEMFVAILISGHLREEVITSQGVGGKSISVQEYIVLRILMRTEYRFFSDNSGFVRNIFFFDDGWKNPNNFMLIEILYWLTTRRKERGDIGLEGYFSIERIWGELQLKGMSMEDTLSATSWLLKRGLVEADHMNTTDLLFADSVKITASGFIHLRLLSERIEYLYGVLTVTPISEPGVVDYLAAAINTENQTDRISMARMIGCVEEFRRFLGQQYALLTAAYPTFGERDSGANYILNQIDSALRFAKEPGHRSPQQLNLLDE